MSWINRRGIKVWDGTPFPEPSDDELAAYPDPPTVLAPCGTEAAYRRHMRHNETACGPCAEATFLRGWRRRLGGAA